MMSTLRGCGEGGLRQKMQNWDVIGRRGMGGSECSGRSIFIFLHWRKVDLCHDQKSCWFKHYYIIDKKFSYWLWCQTAKSSVIRQRYESQNECFKKIKHAKFSEKRTFLTPWYVYRPLEKYIWKASTLEKRKKIIL